MSFASFRLGRLAPFVLPASLALGVAVGCSVESTPEEDDPTGGSSGAGGATAGAGGSAAGSGGGTGGGGGAPTGGVSGAGGASGGSGGAAAGTGGIAGMAVGGTAGMAGQLGGAGSAGVPGGTGGTLGGEAGMGAQGGAGAAGDTGAAGTTTAGTAGTGGMAPMGFLIEDYEAATDGQAPTGWDTFIAWNKNGQNPSGGAQALVSTVRAHSGTKSVHFIGGSNPAQITRPLPGGTNKLYVRAWLYMTRQLGMNPGANHETLIGIRGTTGSVDNEIRFGEIKGVIGTNETPSDNISPKMDQWGMGPVVSANAWHCFEVAFLADGAQHTVHGWVDGTLVHEVTATDQWQNAPPLPATWLNGKFLEVVLGWHSFSSANNEVWMDDLVLSNAPIGC